MTTFGLWLSAAMTTLSLHVPVPSQIQSLADVFGRGGFHLYLVGGAVRDCVMGLQPKDYDLATNATPDQVISVLASVDGLRCDLTGRSFGVVRARFGSGGVEHEYEIATFRRDVGEGRRPSSVVFTTIDEDVQRRDLTINALFYDLASREVVDLVGGLEDIHHRVIRTVGRPEDRFREDRLRIMRAFRFAGRFGWTLEARTLQAIYADNCLSEVSPERIRDEFVRGIASATSVHRFLSMLDHAGMWQQIFPGLTVSCRSVETRSIPVVLATLLDDNDPAIVARRLNELKYTSQEAAQAAFLVRFRDLDVRSAFRLKKQQISCNVSNDTLFEYCRERGMPDEQLTNAFAEYAFTVSGVDLAEQGFSGVSLGRELERLELLHFQELLAERRIS